MARRVKFVSRGSGLDVQKELRKPGHPYAALVAAGWPEDRTAYVVVAPNFGAYAFMQPNLADELERSDLTALTRALKIARSQPGPIKTISVTFPLDAPVEWSDPTPNPPAHMPEEAWTRVVDRLQAFEHSERRREDTERTKFRATFERRAAKLLPTMCRDDRNPGMGGAAPLTHRIVRGRILLKRGRQKVGRYHPSERVLTLISEEDRADAIKYLEDLGEHPLLPIGDPRPLLPRLRGQVNIFEDHYFVVYSEGTHNGDDFQYDPKIAVYNATTREMLSVVAAWSEVAIELLEAHGLSVEREIEPIEASGRIYMAADRLAWDQYSLDPAGTRARLERDLAKMEKDAAALGLESYRPIRQRGLLSPTLATNLSGAVAHEVRLILERADSARIGGTDSIGWNPDQHNWEHRTAVLNQNQLLGLAACVAPIAPPPSGDALVTEAMNASPAHAPLLAARWLRDFQPAWFADLPWEDRDLPGRGAGAGTKQRYLQEMTDWQVAQTTQPRMVRLLTSLEGSEHPVGSIPAGRGASTFPNPDWDPMLTQNDVARIWLTVAALSQHRLVEGSDPFKRHTCLVCQRTFPVGTLAIATVDFTRSDRVCRRCADLAKGGLERGHSAASDQTREATTEALRSLAQELDTPPTRAALSVPLKTADDETLAVQIALRMVIPNLVGLEDLRVAGVLPDAYRPSRGVYSIANDGHACRSLFERQVDDFLSAHGIAHETEPPYPRDDELNSTGLRADWLLPGGTFVEAAGMTNAAYMMKLDVKRQIAARHSLDLIILTPEDLTSLDTRFARWLGASS